MRTSAPFVVASANAPRKPALKRRRLNQVPDFARALIDNSNVAPMPNSPSLTHCAKLSCSTCHRALSAAIRPGVTPPSVCSRCTALTCAICARTCTSYTHPSSFPPTPALTRSPSPSATPLSPKRITLGLSHAAMNCDTTVTAKRKKPPIDKEDGGEGDGALDASVGCDHHDVIASHHGTRDGSESVVVVHGCGRVVCRACCIESVPNDGKLCVDCFALV